MMKLRSAVRVVVLAALVSGCASMFASRLIEPLRFQTEVEYIEVGSLVAASENVRVPLGPGRSYWFNGLDGSRWASDLPMVPPGIRVILLQQGVGIVSEPDRIYELRHVGGPRLVKRGWYGRVIEELPGEGGTLDVIIEDGRRFEVAAVGRRGAVRVPFEVLLSDDTTRIFVLPTGGELAIRRQIVW